MSNQSFLNSLFEIRKTITKQTRFGPITKYVVIHKKSGQQCYPLSETAFFGKAECEWWINWKGRAWIKEWQIEQILLGGK